MKRIFNNAKKNSNIIITSLIVGMLLLGLSFLPSHTSQAAGAGPVTVDTVGYYSDEIIVNNNGNSKIYYALEDDAAKGNWAIIDVDPGLTTTMFDISWLNPTKENILKIKGDADDTEYQVTISEKPSKFSMTINYSGLDNLASTKDISSLVNIMSSAGSGSNPIGFKDLEWKKGASGTWADAVATSTTDGLTAGLMNKLLVKGTYLYFRLKAVDDEYDATNNPSPDGTGGRRFSDEVKVKIAKKADAVVYDINGESFTADFKYGKEYHLAKIGTKATDPTDYKFVKVTDKANKPIKLFDILNDPTIDGSTKDKGFPEMTIQVRDYATTKSVSSQVAELKILKQRILDDAKVIIVKTSEDDILNDCIYIYCTGNKYLNVQIPAASADLPYEYSIIKPKETFNPAKAVWTPVVKGTAFKILADKAVDGAFLYIRQKALVPEKDPVSDMMTYTIASTYVSYQINYPFVPVVEENSFTFIRGYSSDISFNIALDDGDRPAFEKDVKNIKLGTKEIAFTPALSTVTGGALSLSITISKDKLNELPVCTNKPLTITFANGTVDKTSVKLTIQIPMPAESLTLKEAKGTDTGSTTISISSIKGVGNTWVYVVGDTAITDVTKQDSIDAAYTPAAVTGNKIENLPITADKYLTVFELNSSNKIVKYKCIQIIADYIK